MDGSGGELRARRQGEPLGAMARGNPVPKFYKSVIDDVIEGVRDIFAEEGADEPVLKELKRRWETKVMQSKATEGFFRHRQFSPQFTLHLPPSFHQTLQTSAGVPVGRGIPQFTGGTAAASEVVTSRPGGAILSVPSGLAYPIQIPAGVTLQTASGQLYKVNMPVVVTQAPGGGPILQNPVQQIFQHLGRQSLPPPQSTTSEATQMNATAPQAPNAGNLEAQKPTGGMEEKSLPSAVSMLEASGNQGEAAKEPVASQQLSSSLEDPWNIDVETAIPILEPSEVSCTGEVSAKAAASSPSCGGELPRQLGPEDIIELIIMGNDLDESALRMDDSNLSFEELDKRVQMESDMQPQKEIASDLEEIIQLDGTGDVSSKADVESPRDGEDEELVGIIDAEDLKVLDEEEEEDGENSTSDNQSLSSTSDTDEPSVDIIEEDPLNSGDDVSEQETPDVFDTDNIIVCQYDKVQRSKNRWKIYLKDGMMCFGGKDYVFSKAIGDAEW